MKKKMKLKNLSIMLASLLGAAALGGGIYASDMVGASAATEAVKYTLQEIFSETGGADVKAKTATDDKAYAALLFGASEGTVKFKRNVALRWFEGADQEKFLNLKLALADRNFETFKITLTTNSTVATKDNKAVNEVVFENKDDGVYVYLNDDSASAKKLTDAAATLTLSLVPGAEFGEYSVYLAENDAAADEIGTIENVADGYAPSSLTPLTFEAKMPEDAADTVTTYIYLMELNGQTFEVNDQEQVTDTAKPVLVVNQQVSSLVIGNAFNVSTQAVDVLDKTPTIEMTYYQYDPDDIGTEAYQKHVDFSGSLYLNTTNYDSDDDGIDDTTVFEQEGKEYVSIKYAISDDSHEEDEEKAMVELVWYASSKVRPNGVVDGLEYLAVEENTQGAFYKTWSMSDVDAAAEIQAYQDLVDANLIDANGNKKTAGSTQEFYLPSMTGLIDDLDGYTNLSFYVCYKSDAGSQSSTSAFAYNSMKLSIPNVGWYAFKVYAVDKAGNKMKAHDKNGDLVEVSAENIWDIEEIPTFKFYIENDDFYVEEATNAKGRKDSESIYEKYTFKEFKFLGCDNPLSEYKLFYVDVDKFERVFDRSIDEDNLTLITYKEIREEAAGREAEADGDFSAFYQKIYLELLAKKTGVDKQSLLDADILVEIEADQGIDKDEYPDDYAASDDAYEWNATSPAFVPQKQGLFMIFGTFTDPDTPAFKAAAYKIIVVEEEKDVIEGEPDMQWWKDNLASVILFSLAGVMLIVIIILLVIKPTDETLEDVDKAAKKEKKSKKDKKEE